MMFLCSLYDKKAEIYSPAISYSDLASAERSFVSLLASGDTVPAQYPEDFDLYYLGDFDPSSGVIKPLSVPRLVLSGLGALNVLRSLQLRRKGGAVGGTAVPPEDKAPTEPGGSSPVLESASFKATPDLL